MHVYMKGEWTPGYLDPAASLKSPRILVHRQLSLAPAADQYFVRQASLPMIANYMFMLGPRHVLRKVISRRREAGRNDAWLSVGVGRLEEDPAAAVAYVLCSGPAAAERVVVPRELVWSISEDAIGDRPGHFGHMGGGIPGWLFDRASADELQGLIGWDPGSGTTRSVSELLRREIFDLVAAPPAEHFTKLPQMPAPSQVRERFDPVPASSSGSEPEEPSYHCFGLGQYAKTQVIPNMGPGLALACAHEINPLQIGPIAASGDTAYDTAPVRRDGERVENAVVAGYHHTHAPIAAELIRSGTRHVVIEKPVATSEADLDLLLDAMAKHPEARVHVAFQRRHSPFNERLLADLGGQPISMSAVVYEVPLPARHWYRWPSSGNSVVSNGCHWIDHFLFLNGSAEVTSLEATQLSTQILMSIELENGASASISLRHEGAPRKGVRDQSDFWNEDASATIANISRYSSDKGHRVLSRRFRHRYRAYDAMYREFARRIVLDLPGDDVADIERSARTVLALAGRISAPHGI